MLLFTVFISCHDNSVYYEDAYIIENISNTEDQGRKDNKKEASGGPITWPADPAAVVIPSAKDLFPGDVALPTTAKIGPNPLPAIPKPINKFKV